MESAIKMMYDKQKQGAAKVFPGWHGGIYLTVKWLQTFWPYFTRGH